MGESFDPGERLPGTWKVVATNLPAWLNGTRRSPALTFELSREEPLTLTHTVTHVDADGAEHAAPGRSDWRADGFVWHGTGLRRLIGTRWQVTGTSDDGALIAVRFERSLVQHAGVHVLARADSAHAEPRRTVARGTADFGITPEEFASLSWLAQAPSR